MTPALIHSLGRAVAALCLAALCSEAAASDMPPLPASAAVVEATPFALTVPVTLPSGESVSRGAILVLRADPELTRPRQSTMPIPQLGGRVLEPASRGEGGVLVAVLLGDEDLGAGVLFFGPPELPERVDAVAATRRLDDAVAAGLRPVGRDAAARALANGSAPLSVARFEDLSPFLLALRCRIEPEALAAAGTPCPGLP